MSDATIRPIAVTLTALAVLTVVLDAPGAARIPTVLAFAVIAPGLALSRFLPDIDPLDRLACALASSTSLTIVASLALVATDRWAGEPVLAAIAVTTIVAALVPKPQGFGRRRRWLAQAQNRQMLTRRRRQNDAYSLIRSPNVDRRRMGLLALSFLLDDDGRTAEAATLRDLALAPVPVALAIGDTVVIDGPSQPDYPDRR